jgi:hypothetical protein
MATHLEQQQEGEQFRVLDPASLPDTPSFPNKSAFLGGGTAAGLALGVGILFLLALNDKSLHTERDVETYLKLPVLAAVPLLELAGYALVLGRQCQGPSLAWTASEPAVEERRRKAPTAEGKT